MALSQIAIECTEEDTSKECGKPGFKLLVFSFKTALNTQEDVDTRVHEYSLLERRSLI